MTLSVTHKFNDTHPDGADATLVRPSNWNDTHALTGGLDYSQLAIAAQGLNFVHNPQTTNCTVVNGDKGNLISLATPPPGLPLTVTLNAASGYDANFSALIRNNSASRGWVIAANGRASFILWPLQTVLVFNSNSSWKLSPDVQPWAAPAGTTFNVDNVNGSDSVLNDGLGAQGTAGAFLTGTNAVNIIHSKLAPVGGIAVQYPPTTSMPITEQLNVSGANNPGLAIISFSGNPGSPTSCQWQPTTNPAIVVDDYAGAAFNGFGFSSSGISCCAASQFAIGDFSNCDFGANGGVGWISASTNARINLTAGISVSGNAAALLTSTTNASCTVAAIKVVGVITIDTLVQATSGGTSDVSNLSFSGTGTLSGTQFIAQRNGTIFGDSQVSWPGSTTAGYAQLGGISDSAVTGLGGLGLGTAPIASALAAFAAGTTTEAQINLASSTAPTSPNNGDIWFDGSALKIRISGATKTFTVT